MNQTTQHSGATPLEDSPFVGALAVERVLAVVRAGKIPDVTGLCESLVVGGIRIIELTFTTPDLSRLLTEAADSAARTGAIVGAGTVTTSEDARTAIDAGAQFLVTPGLGREASTIVGIAHGAGAAVVLGAMTPSEVLTAIQLGADVVKIFPARLGGPQFFRDLRGPFPDARLLPSGGVSADNARDFLAAGAIAVSAGTGVIPPEAVEAADWTLITENARVFRQAFTS